MSPRRYAGSSRAHRWRNVALVLGLLLSVLAGIAGSLAYSALTRKPAVPSLPGVTDTRGPASPTPTIGFP